MSLMKSNMAHFPILPRVVPGHRFYPQNLSDLNPSTQTFFYKKEHKKETSRAVEDNSLEHTYA